MAATTLAGVMAGIETRLKTISGLRTTPYLPSQVTPPQASIEIPAISNYREAFGRSKFVMDVSVMLLIDNAVDRISQPLMATYADVTGANSIPLAIEGDRTLGGTVDDAIVVDFRPLGIDEVNAIGYIGGIFTVHCICRGV